MGRLTIAALGVLLAFCWQFATVTFVRPAVFAFTAAGSPAVAIEASEFEEKP